MRNIVVALDAGHGKFTPGKRCMKALDRKETREWFLNNRIVERVCELLAPYDKIKIVRTNDRSGDVDTPLLSRCHVANTAKADIFISVHHNAGANGSASGGTTVYTYTGTKHSFAQDLYNQLIVHTELKGNRSTGCLQAKFAVLKYTHMPAILIENGFMDSKTDIKIILTEEHAEKSAQAIAEFLIQFAQ